ncbi:MAG: chloride channel protein [bacterium]
MFSENTATAAICGVSAIVGAVFHSSIGGGIFAVEILQREKINYSKLFPAILASSTAVFVAESMGWEAVYYFPRVENTMQMSNILLLFLLSVITGFMGVAYTKFYLFVTTVFGRDVMKKMPLKTIAGTAVAAFSVFFMAPELMGTSSTVFSGVLGKNHELLAGWSEFSLPVFAVVIFFAVLKAFANCVTVGSGMSAGFTGPATITGILTGAAFALFFGISPTGPDYYAFVAAGFSGILASSMNIPLAAAVIAVETFGLEVSFPAGIAAVVGFQINRQHTIYRFAFRDK